MLIQRATLLDGTVVDIRTARRITEVAATLAPRRGEDVFDAARHTVIPGLHDHHVHLRSAAAAAESVSAGPPHVHDREEFRRALARAQPDSDGWIRAVGYHESVAGPLDRATLDAISPPASVRVQHRSGALWILNSVALARLGIPDHPDGRLFRAERTPTPPLRVPSLRPVSQRLAECGVTGVTDATPGQSRGDVEALAAARRSDDLRQRLHAMADPDVDAVAGVTLGPVKLILDDDTLDFQWLKNTVRQCHSRGRAAAVHCVTDAQLVMTIAALKAAGSHPGDRVEHAAVVPDDCLDDLASLGVIVVTQPNFVAERGDVYLAEIPPPAREEVWRVRSLRAHHVKVALSTDLPFGDGDPWAAMRAAVHRRTPSGATLNTDERVDPMSALTMFFGHPDRPAEPRVVATGQPADLCVLGAPPRQVLAELDAGLVTATIIAGKFAYLS
ncbi:MAG TPA: amidohydrolase family protein [Mycobacterium sp.]|nr:amidohydrolase family protein [Mycobacterium sp.]